MKIELKKIKKVSHKTQIGKDKTNIEIPESQQPVGDNKLRSTETRRERLVGDSNQGPRKPVSDPNPQQPRCEIVGMEKEVKSLGIGKKKTKK